VTLNFKVIQIFLDGLDLSTAAGGIKYIKLLVHNFLCKLYLQSTNKKQTFDWGKHTCAITTDNFTQTKLL